MSNYNKVTAVVPMPAAMAGLTSDFASVRAVLAGLGTDLATGGVSVDTQFPVNAMGEIFFLTFLFT